MARTLIWNTSATAQTLPAAYNSETVQPGYGWIVSDESSLVVAALGGFADMHGKWAVSAISTDEALGAVDMSAAGVALIADVVATIGGGGGGGGGPVAWATITGKPTFAAVATSGAYADLSGKPALATVATSGLYSDLSGTPAIPTAGNSTALAVSATGSAGVQAEFARVDHQHAHGNLAGGAMHSLATTLSAGFLSAADKSKLDGLASVATSGAYADLSGAPSLATVATSGSYDDLTGKPSLFSGAYADLTGKPVLADVATSGAYADLSGTPVLAAVATSGSYADLSGTPTLSTVASSGAYTDLTATPNLAPVATTGAYADLSGKPSLAAVATSGAYADLSGKPSLATVATSGAYADLSGKPSLADVATSGSYDDLSDKPSKSYDIASFASGSLALSATTMKFYAPKNLTLTALNQGGGATVKVQVAGADITYPKSVTAGQVISTVVTSAGTDNYFTISAVEA